jgi:hypothetical protein
MKRWVTHIWVVVLTGMLVLSLGLRGLAAPCQNGHCGTGGCATSATPCPPSCTCHLSQGPDGDSCCHSAKTPETGHGAAPHGTHGQAPRPVGTDHGQHDAARHNQSQHHASPEPAAAPDQATGPGAHCAPTAPQGGGDWPHLSLPDVQAPALLAATLILSLPAPSAPVSAYRPWLAAWVHAPPLRPPAA